MIKKEIQCYECGYSSKKFDNEEECLKCEAKFENTYMAEMDRFYTFSSEIDTIVGIKNEKIDPSDPDEVLPVIHCSKCLKLIHENTYYVEAFGYKLCLCCAIPMLKTFAKNYMTFKTQFANQVDLHEQRSVSDCDAKLILDSQCNCNSTSNF